MSGKIPKKCRNEKCNFKSRYGFPGSNLADSCGIHARKTGRIKLLDINFKPIAPSNNNDNDETSNSNASNTNSEADGPHLSETKKISKIGCQEEGCKVQNPSYGEKGGKPTHCAKHGRLRMMGNVLKAVREEIASKSEVKTFFYYKTKYPDLYKHCYWGGFNHSGGEEHIFENRNRFVKDFDIISSSKNSRLRNKVIEELPKEYFDHSEFYETYDGYISVVSPYDHVGEIDKGMEKNGWFLLYPLYGCNSITFAKKWTRRLEPIEDPIIITKFSNKV